MQHDLQIELIDRLLAKVDRKTPVEAPPEGSVPVASYESADELRREIDLVFRRQPLVVGHASEVRQPGDFITSDAAGVPIWVVRDRQGELRAFLNVCRHRGSQLVAEASGHGKKAAVCRYHGWTYALDGTLFHVPKQADFPGLQLDSSGLVALPVESRYGFVWVTPTPGRQRAIDDFLGPVGTDLAAFSLEGSHLYRRASCRRKANWKLVIEAFLEGYHAPHLHRQTLARFFLDETIFDRLSPHVRSVGARSTLREAPAIPRERWDIRKFATVFYYVFPNTILVFHPDCLSQISVYPDGVDGLQYQHAMILPAAPETDAEREHWARTYALIEETVFQKEDLDVAESIQRCLGSGANESFRLGALERPIQWFREELARGMDPRR